MDLDLNPVAGLVPGAEEQEVALEMEFFLHPTLALSENATVLTFGAGIGDPSFAVDIAGGFTPAPAELNAAINFHSNF